MERRLRADLSADDVAVLSAALRESRKADSARASCSSVASTSAIDVHAACASSAVRWRNKNDRNAPFRLSLLTMVKDASTLLREWVPYHLLLGAAHIYVVNNDCGDSALTYGRCDGLLPYVDAGMVTLIDPAFRCRRVGRAVLLGALIDELVRRGRRGKKDPEREWVLEVDPDEYLVMPPHVRLPEFLSGVATRGFDSVPLPWRIFGTSFRANTTRVGSVGANYQLRLPLALTFENVVQLVERQKAKDQVHPYLFKEMVRLAALGNATRCRDPHGAHSHRCVRTLDWVAERSKKHPLVRTSEEQAPMPAAVARAFIHHYTFLSEEDWERKKLRGRPRKGANFARRQGKVDPLFSAVQDTTLTDRLALLAADAKNWSTRPEFVQRCAASLQRGDAHFVQPPALALAAAARRSARFQYAKGRLHATQQAATWMLERWAQSGHESRGPMAARAALGFGNSADGANSSMAAARWLLAQWNHTLGEGGRQRVADTIAEVVGAYPKECAEQPSRCAGWTSLKFERV